MQKSIITQTAAVLLAAVMVFALAPSAQAGPVLWLDASDVDGDGNAANDPTDGAGIATWVDKSGNDNHLSQSTAGIQPDFKTGVLNSMPVVRFSVTDASDALGADYLTRSDTLGIFGNPDVTVFAVAKTTGDNKLWKIGKNAGSLPNRATLGGWLDSSFRYNGGAKIFGGNAITSHGVAAWRTGAEGSPTIDGGDFWDNGAAASSTAINSGSESADIPLDADEFLLGRWRNSGSGDFDAALDGDVAEFIVFHEHLTDTQVNDVNAYLGDKWGITVSGGGDPDAGAALVGVPEPASLALFGLGGLMMVTRRRKA